MLPTHTQAHMGPVVQHRSAPKHNSAPGSTMSPSPRMEKVGSVSTVPLLISNMSLMGPSMFFATPIITGVKNTQ